MAPRYTGEHTAVRPVKTGFAFSSDNIVFRKFSADLFSSTTSGDANGETLSAPLIAAHA